MTPLRLEWVDALLFPSGVGFLMLELALNDPSPLLSQLVDVNYYLCTVHPPFVGWGLPELRFGGAAYSVRIRDLTDFLTRGMTSDGDIVTDLARFTEHLRQANPPRYSESEAGQVYGERCHLFSYAFADELMRKGAYVSQQVEEVRGLMDRFTDFRHKHWFNEVTRRLTVLENRSRSAGRRAGKVTRPTPPKAMIVSTHHLTAFWFDSALEEKRDAKQSVSKFLADSLDVLKETGREGGHPHGLRPFPNRLARTCKSNIEQFEQVTPDLMESDNRRSSDARRRMKADAASGNSKQSSLTSTASGLRKTRRATTISSSRPCSRGARRATTYADHPAVAFAHLSR